MREELGSREPATLSMFLEVLWLQKLSTFVLRISKRSHSKTRNATTFPKNSVRGEASISNRQPVPVGLGSSGTASILNLYSLSFSKRQDLRSFWSGKGVHVGDRLLHLRGAKEAGAHGLCPLGIGSGVVRVWGPFMVQSSTRFMWILRGLAGVYAARRHFWRRKEYLRYDSALTSP